MIEQARIEVEVKDHIGILTINNPPANTWTLASLKQLEDIVIELDVDRTVYALILTGQGERFFSAGADLDMFADGDKSVAWNIALQFDRAYEAIRRFKGVTIAAINGYAMGGGLEAALACDIRIAEHHAILALPETHVGLLPCAGGTQQLPRLVGEGWAKKMILCGEKLHAQQALDIGLVEEVTSPGQSLSAAMIQAEHATWQSPIAVSACKRLIDASYDSCDGKVQEREAFMKLFDSKDQQEGVQAFLEKRKPQWRNE
ncbi:enoyl-CoA hydratase [Thaumasiovibrio subtropicus]|uniref:enoyl-CoA hydratase n=1 Tax=Thaumasiovibrio subtropicus TaxID=1891207 RepID=UPI000B34F652|nr:enoyl-CoA hydratase [Thaumasiovibrio subtropicus]